MENINFLSVRDVIKLNNTVSTQNLFFYKKPSFTSGYLSELFVHIELFKQFRYDPTSEQLFFCIDDIWFKDDKKYSYLHYIIDNAFDHCIENQIKNLPNDIKSHEVEMEYLKSLGKYNDKYDSKISYLHFLIIAKLQWTDVVNRNLYKLREREFRNHLIDDILYKLETW
jgi:hypothetical protein